MAGNGNTKRGICSLDGCGKPHKARGYCEVHYRSLLYRGDPTSRLCNRGEPQRYYREVVLTYKGDECLIWPFGKDRNGYGQISVERQSRTVSRQVCIDINGPPPGENFDAAHSCGNGHLACVAPNHLRWATRKENMADKKIHGTHLRGQAAPSSKLTSKDVEEIKRQASQRLQRDIAADFGIHQGQVSKIIAGKRWGCAEK